MKTSIHWGILGAGVIAHKFAEGLKQVQNAELIAVGSRNKEKAAEFASKFNLPQSFGSYEELVASPEIDVIYIATPHPFHCEHTLLCLENNKAVLCEKPLAMNAIEVEKMIAKAKEKNLFLMEALWTRFLPSILKTEELIQSGAIGEIIYLKSDFGFKSDFNPEGRLFNKKLGGGSLLDIGIYPVFIALLLLGEPEEITAEAFLGSTQVDESISIINKYKQGAMAMLHSTLLANTPIETEIAGTTGQIRIHRKWHNPTFLTYTPNQGEAQEFRFEYKGNGYEYEAQEVTNCLLAGKTHSDLLPLAFSEKLIKQLDTIRGICKIEY